jgi:hypothetical protein
VRAACDDVDAVVRDAELGQGAGIHLRRLVRFAHDDEAAAIHRRNAPKRVIPVDARSVERWARPVRDV